MTNLFSPLYAQMLRQDVKVVEYQDRWYITMGNPGYNSHRNNLNGYVSKEDAEEAIRYHSQPRVEPVRLKLSTKMVDCTANNSPLLFNPRS